jgi:glycosyltransferase involved in cell wall biosynthesis
MSSLVSCIMPTWNRKEYIGAAVDSWLKQTYENRELIILDDGDGDGNFSMVHPRIQHIRNYPRELTGTKRNHCCALAQGEIICHFDTDDWSAPNRIADQVARLQGFRKPVTGYSVLLYWDIVKQEAKRYRASIPGYVVGATMTYLKSWWEDHQFPDQQEASDNAIIFPNLREIEASPDPSHMVARIHGNNVSPKTGIKEIVPREMVPAEFWENERLRANGNGQLNHDI